MLVDGKPHDLLLLVDDSPDELQMLVDVTGSAGYWPIAAANGDAALRLAEQITPRLIVLDAVMPGIDGFELCRRLKRNPRLVEVPVVFMTGLTDTAHVVEGLEAGAVDYVTKPVIVEELLARIRVHLANARRAQGARIGLDATGRHLFALDRDGEVLWCTPQAAASLGLLSPSDRADDEVAAQLRALATVPDDGKRRIERRDGLALTVEYLCIGEAGEFLYRLIPGNAVSEETRLSREFDLTTREAEVLAWTARGKVNRDISEILGISPRTVDKHLERIFAKLGVENRASATSVAMRVLLERD